MSWVNGLRRPVVSDRRCKAAVHKGPVEDAAPLPELPRKNDRVEVGFAPPRRFVAAPVKGAVMAAAEGDYEFVADPAAQRPRLYESQMMSVRWTASAEKAWLRGYELEVRTIAVAAWFAQGEGAFVDMPSDGIAHATLGAGCYSGRYGVVRGGDRRRRDWTPATSFPGISRHQVRRLALGQPRGGGRRRELDIWCGRLIGGRRLRLSRDGRVVIAEAGRNGQRSFGEFTVAKIR
jgi:hypothetical protein